MLIDEIQIKECLNDEKLNELSKSTYQKAKFSNFAILQNPLTRNYDVKSQVQLRYYKNNVQLEIDKFNQIKSLHCDCFYASLYNKCEHIGATLYKLNDLKELNGGIYRENTTISSISKIESDSIKRIKEEAQMSSIWLKDKKDEFFNTLQSPIKPIKNKIIAQLSSFDTQSISLTFKTGQERLYLIKDLTNFINNINLSKKHSYSSSYEMNHNFDNFDESSQKQIEFIKRMNDFYRTMNANTPMNHLQREIKLTGSQIDDFFDVYQELDNEYCPFELENISKTVTIKVRLNQIEDFQYFEMDYSTGCHYIIFGKDYIYNFKYLSDHALQRLEFENNQAISKLFDLFRDKGKAVITKDKFNEFYRHFLLPIDEFVVYENFEPSTFCEIENKIEIYADINGNDQISVNIVGVTDTNKKYGFSLDQSFGSLNFLKAETIIKQCADEVDYETHTALIYDKDEHWMVFTQEVIPYLSEFCDVYISELLKTMGKSKKYNFHVKVSVNHNLLAVDIDSIDMDKDEIIEVLRNYRKKKRYHRLKNGQVIQLQSNDLEELDKMLDSLSIQLKSNESRFELPNYRLYALDNLQNQFGNLEVEKEEHFQELIEHISNFKAEEIIIPKKYDSIFRDYQKFGYRWIKTMSQYGLNGILADDMGLGKSLQMIAIMETEKISGIPSLVVCPATLILNWGDEIKKFTQDLKTLCILGTPREREQSYQIMADYDVVIVSYDYLKRDIELLRDFQFNYVVLDEAQSIKNHITRNAMCAKQLTALHRFALTGTPIENSLAELWSIFDFLMPNYLYNYTTFQKRYENAIVKNQDKDKQADLKRLVKPFLLRRLKKDVLTELPDKIENTYFMNFNEQEKKLYTANLISANQELQKKLKIDQSDRFEILTMLMRLRQICCEPRLIYDNVVAKSSKLEGCIDLIRALKSGNHKTLVFSSFTSVLELIEKELNQEDIDYLKLTGSTSKEERKRLVEKFQESDIPVFLISLKAGGTGLNLTAADAVIHYDPWWNISAQNQATDRTYRIGQEKNVQVFKLIMKDSIEEKILDMQKRKQNLADNFVEDNEGIITTMNLDELVDLLKE